MRTIKFNSMIVSAVFIALFALFGISTIAFADEGGIGGLPETGTWERFDWDTGEPTSDPYDTFYSYDGSEPGWYRISTSETVKVVWVDDTPEDRPESVTFIGTMVSGAVRTGTASADTATSENEWEGIVSTSDDELASVAIQGVPRTYTVTQEGLVFTATYTGEPEPVTSDNDVPVYLTQEATTIDVTLDDKLIISNDEGSNTATVKTTDGKDLKVQNNLKSVGVKVTAIQADDTDGNGYSLEAYDSDFTEFAADSKKYASAYDDTDIRTEKELDDKIVAESSKDYPLSGKMSVSTEDASNIQIGRVVLTIGMDEVTP